MPIFEYECKNGHVREVILLGSVRPNAVLCETCGETAFKIISTPSAFQWGEGPKESHVSAAIKRVKAKGL